MQQFQDASKATAESKHKKLLTDQLQLQREQAEYAEQQRLFAEEEQDLAILRDTERRIEARRSALSKKQTALSLTSTDQPGAATTTGQQVPKKTIIKVKKPALPSRQQELRFAALTRDQELLRETSDRIKSEERSDDDQEAILRELNPLTAAQRLFNPKTQIRSKHGYVLNSFVANDQDTDDMSHEHSVDRQSDDEDQDGGSDSTTPDDGDPSSDYVPSSSSTSPQKHISAKQWREYQSLKQAQRADKQHRAHQQDRHHSQGHHDTLTPRYNISIAEPPEHGDWRDIQYLVTTFKDKHTKYVHRCGEGHHLSVWECYTATAKACIVQHLTDIATDPSVVRNAAFLETLSDADLYTILQEELGISYDVEVEQTLKSIKFEGSILDNANWVIFRTAWQQVLARVTPAGQVQPRRLAELFRNSIPDDFMHTWLTARKHQTWTDAYSAAVAALKDTKWQTCYSKHIIAKAVPKAAVDTRPKHQQQPPGHSQTTHQTSALSPPSQQPAIKASPPTDMMKPFDPLKFRTKAGLNVNPNLKGADFWENTSKSLCTRCNELHRWTPDFCTARQKRDGSKIDPPLTAQEYATRLKTRWDRGFYFSKPISDFKGPSAQESAAATSTAAIRLAKDA
jgi:hypothetical protein